MTTITRQQLRDAIEAGVANVNPDAITAKDVAALRKVGATADLVARGTYVVITNECDPQAVHCPLGQAIPDFFSGGAERRPWAGWFTTKFDRVTRAMLGGEERDDTVLCVVDDEREAGAA